MLAIRVDSRNNILRHLLESIVVSLVAFVLFDVFAEDICHVDKFGFQFREEDESGD